MAPFSDVIQRPTAEILGLRPWIVTPGSGPTVDPRVVIPANTSRRKVFGLPKTGPPDGSSRSSPASNTTYRPSPETRGFATFMAAAPSGGNEFGVVVPFVRAPRRTGWGRIPAGVSTR